MSRRVLQRKEEAQSGELTAGCEAVRTQTSASWAPEPQSFPASCCRFRRRVGWRACSESTCSTREAGLGFEDRGPACCWWRGEHARPECPVPRGLRCSWSSFSYTFSSARRALRSLSLCKSSCCLNADSSCSLERPRRQGEERLVSRGGQAVPP